MKQLMLGFFCFIMFTIIPFAEAADSIQGLYYVVHVAYKTYPIPSVWKILYDWERFEIIQFDAIYHTGILVNISKLKYDNNQLLFSGVVGENDLTDFNLEFDNNLESAKGSDCVYFGRSGYGHEYIDDDVCDHGEITLSRIHTEYFPSSFESENNPLFVELKKHQPIVINNCADGQSQYGRCITESAKLNEAFYDSYKIDCSSVSG